jgi:hypothetical protein
VLIAVLRGWRLQTVLVGPMAHQATMAGFFTTLLGRPPTPIGGVLAWWNVDHWWNVGHAYAARLAVKLSSRPSRRFP